MYKKTVSNFHPSIFSKNTSIQCLRLNVEYPKGDENRYPLGLFPHRTCISMGSRSQACLDYIEKNNPVVVNSPEFIKNASNKLTAKKLFVENGVPTQKWVENLDDWEQLKFPLIFKKISSYGGDGIIKIHTKKDAEELVASLKASGEASNYFIEEYFTRNIKNCKEFRVHTSPLLYNEVFQVPYEKDGEIHHKEYLNGTFSIARKLIPNKVLRRKGGKAFARNTTVGDAYFTKEVEQYKVYKKSKKRKKDITFNLEDIERVSRRAVEALGLDFGAVDILFCSKTGKISVLEVNSAPSLGDEDATFTKECYKMALPRIIENKALLMHNTEIFDVLFN